MGTTHNLVLQVFDNNKKTSEIPNIQVKLSLFTYLSHSIWPTGKKLKYRIALSQFLSALVSAQQNSH